MSRDQHRSRRRSSRRPNDDLRRAIDDLEDAVQDLVHGARDELTQRTADGLRQTAQRLRDGLSASGSRGDASMSDDALLRPRSRKLYRDPDNGYICGVCAGFAQYFGVETWVTRCVAITALIFVGSITLPAYFIAYVLMERRPRQEDPRRTSEWRYDHRSPAPEFGPRFSPRRSLRNIQADLREVELRLRRAEGHVTSDQYYLRKELGALDR
ncbi:MAG: PspC domain-containing protein [Pseudomonadota bacterium]